MSALKFTRKLGTDWEFPLTWRDRTGARQQITGWVTPTAFWRSLTNDTPIYTDTGGFTLNETADPNTYGNFTYRRDHAALLAFVAGGTYRLDFEATLGSDIVPVPEENYIIVEVKA